MRYAQLCMMLAVVLWTPGSAYAASEIEELKIQLQQMM